MLGVIRSAEEGARGVLAAAEAENSLPRYFRNKRQGDLFHSKIRDYKSLSLRKMASVFRSFTSVVGYITQFKLFLCKFPWSSSKRAKIKF